MKKILLIHGWNYANYTSLGSRDAWANRQGFVDLLKSSFDVITLNLPGFGGVPDPVRPYKLDDFVKYLDEIILREKPDAILGYSFGGAVLLHWKYLSKDTSVKVFLVSPA